MRDQDRDPNSAQEIKRKMRSSEESLNLLDAGYEIAHDEACDGLDPEGISDAHGRMEDLKHLAATDAPNGDVLSAIAQLEEMLDDLDASLPPNSG